MKEETLKKKKLYSNNVKKTTFGSLDLGTFFGNSLVISLV
jgi:hypothetical protein